jgi:MFS-type transporter involved in bile tolerance (Atg22 family)
MNSSITPCIYSARAYHINIYEKDKKSISYLYNISNRLGYVVGRFFVALVELVGSAVAVRIEADLLH